MNRTYRYWIISNDWKQSGYHNFKSFKVYWAYREYLNDQFKLNFKPTSIEQFFIDNGFEMVAGERKDFSTYDNCGRSYKDVNGNIVTVGLMGTPVRISITYPYIIINGEPLETYPTEDLFPEILKQVITKNK